MEEQLVTFDTAKLAKEKGFTEITKDIYISIGLLEKNMNMGNKYKRDYTFCTAPSQALLQKWLRDKYKLHICVDLTEKFKWKCIVRNYKDEIDRDEYSTLLIPFDSYEEALEQGLKSVLNYI